MAGDPQRVIVEAYEPEFNMRDVGRRPRKTYRDIITNFDRAQLARSPKDCQDAYRPMEYLAMTDEERRDPTVIPEARRKEIDAESRQLWNRLEFLPRCSRLKIPDLDSPHMIMRPISGEELRRQLSESFEQSRTGGHRQGGGSTRHPQQQQQGPGRSGRGNQRPPMFTMPSFSQGQWMPEEPTSVAATTAITTTTGPSAGNRRRRTRRTQV